MEEHVLREVDRIFYQAYREGRTALYEFEIYEILSQLGIETPNYVVVTATEELHEDTLKGLGQDIVIKIVSSQIAHKQKIGGVKIVRGWELSELKKLLPEMKREVLSHFDQRDQPKIEGFLLAEFIGYTPSLGNETMIGYREDAEFGPVVLVTKGGDDAEFFAQHYDAANLILPPLTAEQAWTFVNQLKIARKFRDQKKAGNINLLADALAKVANLACSYSSASASDPKYLLRSLDINPLVITEEGRLVAIDGFAEFSPSEVSRDVPPTLKTNDLEMFFRPQNVAVIGVSTDLSRPNMAREIAILLHSIGQTDLYLVNQRGGSLELNGQSYQLYQSFQEIPETVDLVVYVAPIASTAQFVEELRSRARAVIVISGLPAKLSYSQFVEEMDKVKPQELRVLGPNCMGVYFAPDQAGKGVNTLFIEAKRLELKPSERSNTALLTQSGALSLTAADKMKNSRIFKTIVSFGNKYDVQITDLLAYFAQDPEIELITLYIEGLSPGEGRLFWKLAQESTKPIIAYKSGKTEAGAKAAASHTAAMSGDYAVFRAACKQAGVILADQLEDYYDYMKVFSLLSKERPQGNRVAAVFNAGFESTIAADELVHLRPATLEKDTIKKLEEIDVHGLVDLSTALLDVTPMANDQIFVDYVETLLQDDNVDCVVVGIVPHSNALKSTPDLCHDPDSMASLLIELNRKYNKPMVVSVNGGRTYDDFVAVMEKGGLAVFSTIRAAVSALDTFVGYHLNLK
ncbi:MAG: hypothetical protein GX971_05920 [Firmicutes bacterium]|nr:hypothetical protein [Bacillota bacterium]